MVLSQPDLGTSILIASSALIILWLGGVKIKYFIYSFIAFLISLPFIISFLKPYQKLRILTFLDPDRDHALFVAYGPYVNPRYALSIIVEHGGSGSRTAAPIAKELFKLIIDRDKLRNKQKNFEEIDI